MDTLDLQLHRQKKSKKTVTVTRMVVTVGPDIITVILYIRSMNIIARGKGGDQERCCPKEKSFNS